MNGILIAVANGSEDIETVTVVDVMRRAGLPVTLASIHRQPRVTCSRGTVIEADATLDQCLAQDWDCIVLPGGLPGAEHLRDSAALTTLLRRQHDSGRWLAAICAAPALVLASHGLLDDYRATCHPGFVDQLHGARYSEERVCTDRHLVTSQGPGTALEFALQLVALLAGPEKRQQVAAPMVL